MTAHPTGDQYHYAWSWPDSPVSGPWLQVLGGRAFSLTNPRPEDIDFTTIATVLARVPRFGGHTEHGIYSVAQHMLEGARAIERDPRAEHAPALYRMAARAFRVHDAHEYVVGDWATPVQQALCAIAIEESGDMGAGDLVKRAIASFKSRVDAAIYPAAGLPWPLAPDVAAIVHEYDLRMCRTERDSRLATPPQEWAEAIEQCEPVQGCDLYPWSEGTVRALYMAACKDLLTIRF